VSPLCQRKSCRRSTQEKGARQRESSTPIVSIDYAFLKSKKTKSGDGGEPEDKERNETESDDGTDSTESCETEEEEMGSMPMLVLRDRESKTIQADVVPRKGDDAHAVQVLSDHTKELGHRKIILKSDQEPSIVSLKERVSMVTDGVEIVSEASPVGESKSNGEVERAIRTVRGQFRTFRDHVENRYMTVLDQSHKIVLWMVAHAANTVDRFALGTDGKTSYQRRRGRKFNKELVDFAGCVCGTSSQSQLDRVRWITDGKQESGLEYKMKQTRSY